MIEFRSSALKSGQVTVFPSATGINGNETRLRWFLFTNEPLFFFLPTLLQLFLSSFLPSSPACLPPLPTPLAPPHWPVLLIDHGISSDLSVGFTDTERRGVLFGAWALKSGRGAREMIGWRDGMVMALRRQRLWILSVTGHTHTQAHTPSGDSNLRAIFRPDDWQLDAHSSPTRLADNSGYPIPRRHPSPLFTPALSIFWTPSTGTRLLLFIFSLHPSSRSLSLSLSLWACCVAITMTEAIRDIYHMCGGVSKRKPSTGLGGG